jgi:hypothetical protein
MWLDAKKAEDMAKAHRLDIECRILEVAEVDQGSGKHELGKLSVRAGTQIKVDQVAAKEMEGDAQFLFRWKAELDKKAWNAAPDSVKQQAAVALTESPTKPAFALKEK